jgi:CDP-4-dehydro-6-deoxyglucose reductase, E3
MPVIRLQPSGRDLPCEPGDTVLGALERAGYALANNCRAGACGECKTKVLCGEYDQGMILDMALSPEDRDAGYGLMCMAKPLSDVVEIEYGTADAQPKLFPPREHVPVVVVDRIARTPRIVELRLRPMGDPLRYWPGQYVMLGDPAAGAPLRPYSIANAPRPDGELALLVTRAEDGRTSAWVHDTLVPGARATLSGPYGAFIGDPATDTPVLCIAAGSGLAPILALTDAALRRGFPHPVTLLFSARTEEDVFDRGLMAWWEARHRRFRFLVTLTRQPGAELSGRAPEVLSGLFPTLADHSVFVAGGPEFVADCLAAVRALGARDELVHTEAYHRVHEAEVPAPDRLVSLPR